MKIKKIFLFSFLVIVTLSLYAEETTQRDENVSNDLMYGSKPSDMPTGGLFHDFKPMSKNMFTDTDLSETPDARLFAGYGIYDVDDSNCVYIDADTSDGSKADSKFQYFKVYNNHSYAVSISDMTFAECQATTLKYHGYPASITTQKEDNALKLLFGEHEFWIGAQRKEACPSGYINYKNENLIYNGYSSNDEVCNDSTPFTSVFEKNWSQQDNSHIAKCMIEYDTEDWTKPLKTCASWWGIERSYSMPERGQYMVTVKDANGNLVEIDIRDFNQKDFPKTINVCTQLDTNRTENAPSAGTQTVTCNSYYDRTVSPRCLENPEQSLCKVDRCRGSIKNKCQLISTGDAPLSYSKESVLINGELRYIKKKTQIKIHEYKCPVVTEIDNCLETQSVTMLPQPCPGTDVDENGTEKRAIRVYGNPAYDGPSKYDADGVLQNLYGKCPDGSLIEVPVNVMTQNNRMCGEYEVIESRTEYDVMCTSHKTSQDYVVQAAVAESDIHKLDPNCIRTNNIIDARPKQDVRIDYETFGFANLAVVKAQIDGKNLLKYEGEPSQYYPNVLEQSTDVIMSTVEAQAGDFFSDKNITIPTYDCTGFPANRPSALDFQMQDYQHRGIEKVYDYTIGNIFDFGNMSKNNCENNNTAIGTTMLLGSDTNDTTQADLLNIEYESLYGLTTITGLTSTNLINTNDDGGSKCVGIKEDIPVQGDIFSLMQIGTGPIDDGPDVTLFTADDVNYTRCREVAICTGTDIENTSYYSGDEQCILHYSTTSGIEAYEEIKAEQNVIVEQWIEENVPDDNETLNALEQDLANVSSSGVLNTDQIDGFTDIYAILEYTDQRFGYVSSYNVRNYKSNIVTVNGMVAQPIVEHSKIREEFREDYTWNYTSYRNYEPDPEGAVVAGASGGIGAVAAQYIMYGTWMGVWGVVIAVVVAAVVYLVSAPTNLLTFTGKNTAEMYAIRNDRYRYAKNPYGYESRFEYNVDGEQRLRYAEFYYERLNKTEKSDAQSHFSSLQSLKKDLYKELNVEMAGFVFPPHESKLLVSDAPSKQWNPWAKSENTDSASGTLDIDTYHSRMLTVHYMGATNTATIIVPYLGDYALEAYNSSGELVSSYLALRNSFINSNTSAGASIAFSHIKFGLNMSLSPNLDGGACRNDLMVGIGGGVSGAYYELGETGSNSNYACAMADNDYVNYNAITTIKIRPLDQGNYFNIVLPKPLPYANRVILGSLGLNEDRLYRCFGNEFPECLGFERITDD